MTRTEFHRLLLPLLAFAMAMMVVPAVLLNALSGATSADIRNQASARQAAAVGADLAANLQRAQAVGIPFSRIPGVERHFQQLLDRFPEFRFLALRDEHGKLLHLVGMPEPRFETILHLTDTELEAGPRAARGQSVPVVTRVGDISVTRMFMASDDRTGDGSQDGGGELVYGVHQEPVASFLTRDLKALAAVMVTLLLLGLPLLHAVARETMLRPVNRLTRLFDRASAGDYRIGTENSSMSQTGRLTRLWNNEVFSLQERQFQLSELAREAVAAADEPEVAAEIERLARLRGNLTIMTEDNAPWSSPARDLCVPVLALAFIAGAILGNDPGIAGMAAASVAALAGGILGKVLASRYVLLRRGIVGALALAALFLLANAISPLIVGGGMLDTALTAVTAMLLFIPAVAALSATPDDRAGADEAVHWEGSLGVRRDRLILLLYLAAGLLAAAVWTIWGPSGPGDTMEAWIGAVMMAAAVGLLWRWRS